MDSKSTTRADDSPTGDTTSNKTPPKDSSTPQKSGIGSSSPQIGDAEYLKNVMLKYFHASKEEQIQLVPVIAMILKFDPVELKQARDAAADQSEGGGIIGSFFAAIGANSSASTPSKPPKALLMPRNSGKVDSEIAHDNNRGTGTSTGNEDDDDAGSIESL